jgi:hypothetical protein
LKEEDRALWSLFYNFGYEDTWNEIRGKGTKVDWWNLLWFSLVVLRHSFIGWMLMLNKVPRKARVMLGTACVFSIDLAIRTWIIYFSNALSPKEFRNHYELVLNIGS